MNWIVWATIGYFFNAVAVTVDKALLSRQRLDNPAVYTFAISCLGLLALFLVPFGWEWPTPMGWVYGFIAGTAFTGGLWCLFTVLKTSEASRVPAYIGSLNPLFVFAISYFALGERLAVAHFVAFLVLVLGGFMMVGGRGGLGGRALGLATLSSALFGVAFVALKLVFGEGTFITGLVVTRLGGFASSLFLLAVPGTWAAFRHSASNEHHRLKFSFLGGQVAGAAAAFLNSYSVSLASVTLVEALQGIQYVFVLVFAVLVSWQWPALFREEFSRGVLVRKLTGTALIMGGLWFLSFS